MHIRPLCLGWLALWSATLPMAAQGQPVFNDDFDNQPLQLNAPPAGWSTPVGQVNVIGESSAARSQAGLPDPLPGHGAYVDLIGTNGVEATRVSPSFILAAGVPYSASFLLAGNHLAGAPSEAVQASFGASQATYLITPGRNFTACSLVFTPSATVAVAYAISFKTVGTALPQLVTPDIGGVGSDRGALLDAVAVTAVPEPASYALLLAGLAALHGLVRRRVQPGNGN